METLHAPHPQQPDKRLPEAQDPWMHAAHTEVREDLQALPFMSPEQEDLAFRGIVDNFHDQNTIVVEPEPKVTQKSPSEQEPYTPRHLRSEDLDFTPTPVSDAISRSQAIAEAERERTLRLAATLSRVNPELQRQAHAAYGVQEEATMPIRPAAPEKTAYIQPVSAPEASATGQVTPESEQQPQPNYRGRHRRLGRFARLFSRFSR